MARMRDPFSDRAVIIELMKRLNENRRVIKVFFGIIIVDLIPKNLLCKYSLNFKQ